MSRKNFTFFYRSRKVHAACNKQQPKKKLYAPVGKNFRSHIPQKKFLTHSLGFQKSQKIKLFADFISKNVIRLNLYCKVYICFGKWNFESLKGECLPENMLRRGVGVHALLDFYNNGVSKNE